MMRSFVRGESFLEDDAMGMTISEKILASHSGREHVEPGEIVNAKVDLAMVHEMLGNAACTRAAPKCA